MDNTEFISAFNALKIYLSSFALRLTKNKEDAKDLLQETAMLAYANLHRFEPDTNFRSWISTIMRNSFINNYRKMKTRNNIDIPVENIWQVMENITVVNQAPSIMMQKELMNILERLPINHKIAFQMFFQGYHYDEIASILNLPIGTIKSRIFYARKKMRDMARTAYSVQSMYAY